MAMRQQPIVVQPPSTGSGGAHASTHAPGGSDDISGSYLSVTAFGQQAVLLDTTLASDPGGGAYLRRVRLQYNVSTSSSDIERIYVNTAAPSANELQTWRNEGGFLRGTPNASYKDDALVRAVPRSDLVAQSGSALEIQNSARTQIYWGRRWRDGVLMRGNGSAAAVAMSDVLVLATGASVPAGTPTNTVIVRT